jgi:hypothetical protein
MHNNRILFAIISFLIGYSAIAQKTVVRGKIFDEEKKPMPFVNISFKHSVTGTISDIDGTFILTTTKPTDTLLISCVGYQLINIPVKKGQEQHIELSLVPNSLTLNEVIVRPGENPAFRILKKINERKKINNPERFNSYQYKAYNKLRLDMNNIDEKFKNQKILNDFKFVFDYMDSSEVFGKNYLPLLISESVSKFYHQRNPFIEREVIEAFNVSGIENNTVSQFSGKMYQKLNVYDNFMTFFEPGFVSPISEFGRMYYKYYLEDSAYLDNNYCYKISFKPKRTQERTFYGYFWANDTTWAIKSVQLRVSSDVNLNLLKDMIAVQNYSKLNDTTWFLTNEELLIDFNLAEKTYGFFGRKSAVYDSIILNQPIPEKIATLTTDTYYEDTNVRKDSTFWVENRKDTLTDQDAKVYKMVDSVKTVPMYKTVYNLVNMLVGYYYVVGPVEIGPYYTTYSTNPIEGHRIRIGGRTSNAFSTKIMFGGHIAYGTKDEKFKYGGNIDYMFNTTPRVSLGGSFYHDIRQLGKSSNAFLDDNILTSIFRRNPNNKLTMVDQYNAFFEKEWWEGFSNKLSFKYQTVFPTEYIPFKVVNTPGDTVQIGSISSSEFGISLHYAYREKFLTGKFERVSLGSRYPIIDLEVKYAPNGIFDSQYEFWNIKVQLSDKVLTSPAGFLKYRVTAGKIIGKLPYPLLELHEGNETYVFDPWAFNMMNYYEFVSDEYVSIYAEQHFQGLFFNRIPLIKKLQCREVVGTKILYGRLSDKNKGVMEFPEGLNGMSVPYYEASVGIENILKVIRIDAMWRFSYLDHPNVSDFGIRGVLYFSF